MTNFEVGPPGAVLGISSKINLNVSVTSYWDVTPINAVAIVDN